DAVADLHLKLLADLGSAQFPQIKANLHVNWPFFNADPSAGTLNLGGVPTIEITGAQLNAGQFISNFLRPIVNTISDILTPIKPLLDSLIAPIPGLSDLPDSVLDLPGIGLDFDMNGKEEVSILSLA